MSSNVLWRLLRLRDCEQCASLSNTRDLTCRLRLPKINPISQTSPSTAPSTSAPRQSQPVFRQCPFCAIQQQAPCWMGDEGLALFASGGLCRTCRAEPVWPRCYRDMEQGLANPTQHLSCCQCRLVLRQEGWIPINSFLQLGNAMGIWGHKYSWKAPR